MDPSAGARAVAKDRRATPSSVELLRCARVLVESLDPEPSDALAVAEAMEAELGARGVRLAPVHHGEGLACCVVNRRAPRRGHGTRTGLEDTMVLPDGRPASGTRSLSLPLRCCSRGSGRAPDSGSRTAANTG
jgi:hypothetical protein